MKDEHPVKMVADTIQDGMVLEPLKTWLLSLVPGMLVPEASKMFDLWKQMEETISSLDSLGPFKIEYFLWVPTS